MFCLGSADEDAHLHVHILDLAHDPTQDRDQDRDQDPIVTEKNAEKVIVIQITKVMMKNLKRQREV